MFIIHNHFDKNIFILLFFDVISAYLIPQRTNKAPKGYNHGILAWLDS